MKSLAVAPGPPPVHLLVLCESLDACLETSIVLDCVNDYIVVGIRLYRSNSTVKGFEFFCAWSTSLATTLVNHRLIRQLDIFVWKSLAAIWQVTLKIVEDMLSDGLDQVYSHVFEWSLESNPLCLVPSHHLSKLGNRVDGDVQDVNENGHGLDTLSDQGC